MSISTPASTPSGPATAPVRVSPRHLAPRPAGSEPAPAPSDPAFPDYPYFLEHAAEARTRHLNASRGYRWGRHPGFPQRDDDLHVPGSALVSRRRPVGPAGVAALVAAGLVTAAAWVLAATGPSGAAVAGLAVAWSVAYATAGSWRELGHRRRVRSTGSWRLSFLPAILLWASAGVLGVVPLTWVPGGIATVGLVDAGLRVGAAVACALTLALWAPLAREAAMISDQLAEARRSTLVR